MAYSERLPTRLNPLAEGTCFSQATMRAAANAVGPATACVLKNAVYSIVQEDVPEGCSARPGTSAEEGLAATTCDLVALEPGGYTADITDYPHLELDLEECSEWDYSSDERVCLEWVEGADGYADDEYLGSCLVKTGSGTCDYVAPRTAGDFTAVGCYRLV